MALIKCKECGSQVSLKANACPKCGAPPPTAEELKQERIFAIQSWGVIIIIVLVLIIGFVLKNSWEESQAEAARIAKVEKFKSNPEIILTEIRALLKEKKFSQALTLGKSYASSSNAELLGLIQEIEVIQLQIKNEAEEKKLLAEVKAVPAKELKKNQELYAKLIALNPKEPTYKQKHDYYGSKIKAHEEEQRALQKKRDALVKKFGNPPMEAGFMTNYYLEVLQYLQKAAHDPNSLEFEGCTDVHQSNQGWVVGCAYRGRNGYGGIVKNSNWFTIRHGKVVKVEPSSSYAWQ